MPAVAVPAAMPPTASSTAAGANIRAMRRKEKDISDLSRPTGASAGHLLLYRLMTVWGGAYRLIRPQYRLAFSMCQYSALYRLKRFRKERGRSFAARCEHWCSRFTSSPVVSWLRPGGYLYSVSSVSTMALFLLKYCFGFAAPGRHLPIAIYAMACASR